MDKEHSYSTIRSYIDNNPVATLGTINPDGTPHGAVVYACADDSHPVVYFLTKTGTQKYKNLSNNERVSITVVNPSENSTLQANGRARYVEDAVTLDMVMKKITRIQASAIEWLPPLAKLRASAYVLIGITIEHARLARFKGMEIGSEHIFTEV
jgi:general stress protein 26